jgi:hypothetical protein
MASGLEQFCICADSMSHVGDALKRERERERERKRRREIDRYG